MKESFQIARDNLKACFKDSGIIASVDHFSDFWARDSFYASWGLLEIEEYAKVKSNLELFIRYQRKNGHIPRCIDRFIVPLKYLGIKVKRKNLKPRYTGVYIYPALDSNILFIMTCYRYIKASGDLDFLNDNFQAISGAVEWLEKRERKELLDEGLFANWADIIIKKGKVLYSNILYTEALDNMGRMLQLLSDSERAKGYLDKSGKIKEEINRIFWDKDYYIDWIYKGKRYDYFSTDGNVLAMLFGVCGAEQTKKIIEYIEKHGLDAIPMRTNHPSYSWWRVKLIMRVVGAPGYQNNSTSWLWLGCIYAVALRRNGYTQKAEEIYGRIASKIKEYSKVYELYASSGVPYKGWYWRSASSFAWSSGLFLWMHSIIKKDNN
jgi:glycogen debranching enzyme